MSLFLFERAMSISCLLFVVQEPRPFVGQRSRAVAALRLQLEFRFYVLIFKEGPTVGVGVRM